MKVVIIGTGNVAHVLGKLLLTANHTILQVYGRILQNAQACAKLLRASPVTNLSLLDSEADLCIIATSDSAIAYISAQLYLRNTTIVHTSGGVSINVLQQHQRYGIIYPLQSLRKDLPYIPKVPLFIDGNNETVKEALVSVAKTISEEVHTATDEERLKLHVAAVFCSNFTNHLLALANRFCDEEQLSFNYLIPLITETVHRMHYQAPNNLQTGPAIRRDEVTIQKHLHVLQKYPLLAEVYRLLTQSIQQTAPVR